MTIADTGEGVASRILEHLYEPFHTTKDTTGTGLGLWVSKGIVDKHGGTIRVRTWRGEAGRGEAGRGEAHGTVFTIWLPTEAIHLVASEASEDSAAQISGAQTSAAHILAASGRPSADAVAARVA